MGALACAFFNPEHSSLPATSARAVPVFISARLRLELFLRALPRKALRNTPLHSINRHPEGRERARVVISGRVGLRDLAVGLCSLLHTLFMFSVRDEHPIAELR
jgi:hypothetical protein